MPITHIEANRNRSVVVADRLITEADSCRSETVILVGFTALEQSVALLWLIRLWISLEQAEAIHFKPGR